MKKYITLMGIILMCFCLLACEEPKEVVSSEVQEPAQEKDYSYEDTAILVKMDTAEKSITFQNVETGLRYTLNYDGVTYFYNRYGTAISAEQVNCGLIADITFDKDDKKLLTLNVSPDYFAYSDITFEEFIKNDARINILGEEYKLDDFMVITDGSNDLEKMEIAKGDVLTVCGKDHVIYAIYLESGHGYLRLENDSYFVGGWIEVGNKTICTITEDMLLTVPEGSYQVLVSNDGISGTKSVTIGRNQEVTLDLGDIDVEKKYGNVLFVLDPSDAQLYVDGEKVDTGAPVSMEYGIHQLICRANGYDTMASYIKVGEPSASISLTLTKTEDEEEEEEDDSEDSSENSEDSSESSESASENSSESTSQSSSENSSESSTESSSQNASENSSESNSESSSDSTTPSDSTTASTSAKVYVDGPEGAEIYVDGNYVGIAPISFTKPDSAGIVVTLRKTGYQTRSYTIQLEDNDSDVHYSFSELTEIGQ